MRTSAVQHVLDILKKEIHANYREGDLLPNERELAEQFNVSRNTVREAVIFLEAYQLVEKTQRGARVRRPSFEPMFHILDDAFEPSARNTRDILNFRRIVESGALPSIIANATEADIQAMEAAIVRMDRALTVAEAAQADYDFHAAMVFGSGNQVLKQLYSVMSRTLVYYLEIGKSDSAHSVQTSIEHRHIVDALRRRSLPDLTAALFEHFEHSECVRQGAQD